MTHKTDIRINHLTQGELFLAVVRWNLRLIPGVIPLMTGAALQVHDLRGIATIQMSRVKCQLLTGIGG